MDLSSLWQGIADSFVKNFIEENKYLLILDGLKTTLDITVCAVLLGTLLGGLICWMRMHKKKWLRNIAKVYIELMRGTPVLVILMIMYYVIMAPLNASGVIVSIITFAMNASAYVSEMLRISIEGIDKGQTEAGLSLGFTKVQTFFKIVLPQAVSNMMPVYQGEVIDLLKSTSIVGYVAVIDLTKSSDIIRARTFDAFFPLIVIAIMYFLVAWLIGLFLKNLTRPKRRKSWRTATILVLMPLLVSSCGGKELTYGNISSEADLKGKQIAIIHGMLAEQYVIEDYGSKYLLSFNSDVDATEALLKGKADAFIVDDILTVMPLRMHPELDTVPTRYPVMPIAACFSFSNMALANVFEKFITRLNESGENKEIYDRWMNGDFSQCHRDIEEVHEGKPLKMAMMATNPPLNFFLNGRYDGYEPELARMFAKEIGRPIEFVKMDFGAIIPALVSEKVDMSMSSISKTEERSQMVIQIPYSESHFVALYRKSAVKEVGEEGSQDSGWKWVALCLALMTIALVSVKRWILRKRPGSAEELSDKDVVIKVSHLQKSYGSNQVLRDVNVEIRQGEVVSVIGPSGTGKSTFLRCLNLLETPDSGNIIVAGHDLLASDANVPMLRRKMGMVFQSFNLFNSKSILENITFAPIELLKKKRAEAESEAMYLLDLVGLAEKADAFPVQLSGGQKQRVAIARALAMKPDIILFDEPTSALDPTKVGEVLGVIRMLARQGLTMIIVTHEMDFAKEVSTRVLYLDEGVIYEDGSPEQIFNHPVGENTRKFINRIHEYCYEIRSERYDYYELVTNINNFCARCNMSSITIDHVIHAVEEGLLITKAVGGTRIKVSYSIRTDIKEISVHTPYRIDLSILDKEENRVQSAILRGICSRISVTPDADGSLFCCELM